ncbi:3-oxoacyl-[acyl-carrier-protein] reductase [Ruminococcus sp. YE71]|uniref:SDR family NAD(P)-dependent oxidoreductase n=1 Tax=unclassified Ruminococcus TaxID=2608920 RepID=UPI00088AE86B|nr:MULTISPECIES: 3-oxoacyl-ACP reductase family protein [unclassified Ruminococcus]SDA26088.1 3-oxoacyl-[acyl-carrier-protein] reductase [Ruminococcus sp. YE78]SFW35849.1 3-oxoacyl-[acyl-carrier-protein] reductase [Ruminococcus sp. YE71]
MSLQKCAVVTGSASGIGASSVKRLAKDGFDVVINYHRDSRLSEAESIAEECRAFGVRAMTVKADISDPSQCDELVQAVVDEFGRIDVLVNNAGITNLTPMLKMSDEDFDRVMRTNAYGTFYMMRSAAPVMKKQRSGSIINISSVGGLYGAPWSIGYAASKGAVIALTKTAAKELAISNIRVNSIAPGGCDTGIIEVNEHQIKEQLRFVTLGRVGRPDEIAGAVSFLASDDSSYITGHVLEVSGGVMM